MDILQIAWDAKQFYQVMLKENTQLVAGVDWKRPWKELQRTEIGAFIGDNTKNLENVGHKKMQVRRRLLMSKFNRRMARTCSREAPDSGDRCRDGG